MMTNLIKHFFFALILTCSALLLSYNGYAQLNFDIGVTEIISPTQVCEGNQEWLTVKVENFGVQVIDSFMLVWDVNGNTDSIWVMNAIPTSPNTNYINVNVDTFTVDSGSNVISVFSKSPNNLPDQNNSNDTITDNIQELYPEITFLDYCVDFLTVGLFIETVYSDSLVWNFEDGSSVDTNNYDTTYHVYPWTPLDSVTYSPTVTVFNTCNTSIDSLIYVTLGKFIQQPPCWGQNSIQKNEKDLETNIYPNPSFDVLNIEVLRMNTKPIKLQLFNSNGSLVYSQESAGSNTDFNTQIDVSTFPRGLYFLRVRNGDGYKTHKVVIN